MSLSGGERKVCSQVEGPAGVKAWGWERKRLGRSVQDAEAYRTVEE